MAKSNYRIFRNNVFIKKCFGFFKNNKDVVYNAHKFSPSFTGSFFKIPAAFMRKKLNEELVQTFSASTKHNINAKNKPLF